MARARAPTRRTGDVSVEQERQEAASADIAAGAHSSRLMLGRWLARGASAPVSVCPCAPARGGPMTRSILDYR